MLISMVILAVGLLGLAALQGSALRLSRQADIRGQATQMAHEMADRMRTNRPAALAGAYVGACEEAECDPELVIADVGSVAENDLAEWCNAFACLLPQCLGSVGQVTGHDEIVSISVQCMEKPAADGKDAKFFKLTMATEI
ncbi:type IV pilus modification protein PilV [Thiocapsa bogorovii]|nr:type IV pilus modification protein PilV [Thiocapsa bogorovii]